MVKVAWDREEHDECSVSQRQQRGCSCIPVIPLLSLYLDVFARDSTSSLQPTKDWEAQTKTTPNEQVWKGRGGCSRLALPVCHMGKEGRSTTKGTKQAICNTAMFGLSLG